MEYQRLGLVRDDQIARITLRNPAAGNRIDQRLLRELEEMAQEIASWPATVVLIDAEGGDFCLGWEEATRDALLGPDPIVDPFGPIAALTCPTIAAIQGRAMSGGLELALSCDIRISDASAGFSMPDVSEGRLPVGGATQRLPRVTGKAAALSMLLLGEEFDGQRAYESGLVSRLATMGQLTEEAEAIVAAIASRGPLALRYAKEAAVQGIDMTLDQGLRFETDLSVILQSTEDRAEGLRAFFEKRPPKFEGR